MRLPAARQRERQDVARHDHVPSGRDDGHEAFLDVAPLTRLNQTAELVATMFEVDELVVARACG
jgi:hypothetical protein